MKMRKTKITWLAFGMVLAILSPLTTHAQADTSPDEYKRNNVTAITTPSAKTEFEGHFTLPFQVQCHGNKLQPGDYTLVVKTLENDKKMVTFQREGSAIIVESHPITPTTVTDQGHSAVLVRHGQGPGNHTLEGIYVESLRLILMLDESGHTQFMDRMFASVKRVPIS